MTSSPASNPASAYPPPVTDDRPCRRCGYSMRGLPVNGRCPECATPVELSLRSDWLQFSYPNWLARLARGAELAFWGNVVWIGFAVLSCGTSESDLGATTSFVAILVGAVGEWLLTTPDPGGGGEATYGCARRITRTLLGITVVAAGIGQLGRFLPIASNPRHLVRMLETVASGTAVAEAITLLVFLRGLIGRLPERSMQRQARFLAWSYGNVRILLWSLATIWRWGADGVGSWRRRDDDFVLLALVNLFVMPPFAFMWLLLLRWLSRRLREQYTLSRLDWPAASSSPTSSSSANHQTL